MYYVREFKEYNLQSCFVEFTFTVTACYLGTLAMAFLTLSTHMIFIWCYSIE